MAIPCHRDPTAVIANSILLLLLLLPSPVCCQRDDLSSLTSNRVQSDFTPTTVIMIVILVAAFLVAVLFIFYLNRRRTAYNNNQLFLQNLVHNATTVAGDNANGLDPGLIENFPRLVYSDVKGLKFGNSPLECAVCLSKFEDQEELTLLPKCDHAFHTDCINEWFASSSTCPVCRNDLQLLSPTSFARDPTEHLAIRVDEDEELRRMGSKNRVFREWRSNSARPAAAGDESRIKTTTGRIWTEEERERRFTLRLPEKVRNGLIKETTSSSSFLRRSATVTVPRAPFLVAGEGSPRIGYSNKGEGEGIYWGSLSVKRPNYGLATMGV